VAVTRLKGSTFSILRLNVKGLQAGFFGSIGLIGSIRLIGSDANQLNQ